MNDPQFDEVQTLIACLEAASSEAASIESRTLTVERWLPRGRMLVVAASDVPARTVLTIALAALAVGNIVAVTTLEPAESTTPSYMERFARRFNSPRLVCIDHDDEWAISGEELTIVVVTPVRAFIIDEPDSGLDTSRTQLELPGVLDLVGLHRVTRHRQPHMAG